MKNVLLLLALILNISIAQSQSLIIFDTEGNDISNSTVYIFATPQEMPLSRSFSAKNISNTGISVNAIRYEDECVDGTGEFYCWSLCLGIENCGTSYERGMPFAQFVDANSISPVPLLIDFQFTEFPEGEWPVGISIYKYTLFDDNNPSDNVSIKVVYNISENVDMLEIVCPDNVEQGTDLGVCTAVVNNLFPELNADISSLTWVINGVNSTEQSSSEGINDVSGHTFVGNLSGLSTVTYTAIDICGYVSTCSFTVDIDDTEAPQYTVPDPCDSILFPGSIDCIFPSFEDVPPLWDDAGDAVSDIVYATMTDNCLNVEVAPWYSATMSSGVLDQGDTWITYSFTAYDDEFNSNSQQVTFNWDIGLGISEYQEELLEVFPNPSNGTFECNEDYKVFTLQGQEVALPLNPGTYVIQGESGRITRLIIY